MIIHRKGFYLITYIKHLYKRLLSYAAPVKLASKHKYFNVVDNHSDLSVGFAAISDDPYLVFSRSLPKGWYIVEVHISSDSETESKLYLGKDGSFDEDRTVLLPTSHGKTIKRVFYVDEWLSKLRFDPVEESCEFKIHTFSVVSLPNFRAIQLMKKKVANCSSGRGDDLISDYNSCFKQKFLTAKNYQDWIDKKESLLFSRKYKSDIKISIVMPVYNSDVAFLDQAVMSVLNQKYKNWELCIADDSSTSASTLQYLKFIEGKDPRIKIVYRSENGNISLASNSALELASGSYVAFMDHDDLLSVYALGEIVSAIENQPYAQIVYTDEDKIDELGRRYDPHFKGGFNRELLLNQNYISHLSCYSKFLVDKVGGFRKGYEGSQDYDFLLRCLKYIESEKDIIHIPKVLYHWRAIVGSTARSCSEKSYTSQAGLLALEDFLSECGEGDIAKSGEVPNTYRIMRPVQSSPVVEIIIPTRDSIDILKPCVDSVLSKTIYKNYKITIVDNDSQDDDTFSYFDSLSHFSNVEVIKRPGIFNYSKINNFAVNRSEADYVLLLNNDIEVISPDWLTEMVSIAQDQHVGCVGAKLYYTDGRIQHAGVTLGIGGVAGHTHKYMPGNAAGYFSRLHLTHEVSAVTAACLLVKRTNYIKAGGLDENNLKVAFNDVDFCLKLRSLGLKNIWTPYAELFHHESVSRGHEDTPEKKERFDAEVEFMKNKWGETLKNDPYYNPNLSLQFEDFSLKI